MNDFLSVAHFLKYSSSAFVVRVAKSGSVFGDCSPFTAKYPGELGNSVVVEVCDVLLTGLDTSDTLVQAQDSDGTLLTETVPVLDSDGNPVLESDGTPVTQEVPLMVDMQALIHGHIKVFSSSAPEGDELHVVVLVAGEVVDTFAYVSTDPNIKLDNGSTNYIVDVVTTGSSWVDLSHPNCWSISTTGR